MNVPTIYEMAFLPFLFAQGDEEPTAANAGGGAAEAPAGGEGSFMQSLWFPILIVCGVYLLLMMIPRNEPENLHASVGELRGNFRSTNPPKTPKEWDFGDHTLRDCLDSNLQASRDLWLSPVAEFRTRTFTPIC